ncbi:HEAT repeat domain-containing protein [Bradyrhizobium sp. SSUT18]|uniref:HEAT repeat domain-containing protein n=1 Tax=unclassified Bradyrhizobium TaxID=2631580 RepID=UPI00244B3142|nr:MULTISPECIES: HEAT repeat domain-containing protein [unclassified Bradyrhizobium]MDH2343842.1 HEAT repeat domain-containing protein [Bradyrhizobium sp. SSUT77]MDH2402293.1 HEAT repeat domain-containing protein [Bradyrhizobium sp. SSUT18]
MTYEAIRRLISRDDDEVINELRALSTASDAFVRRTAIEVIGQHRRGHELRATIVAALSDTSDYVRRTTCGIVEQWKLAEAHDLVLLLLKEPEAPTRECALRTLAAIWNNADFQTVFGLYKRDPEIAVRREAAWTLRQGAAANDWQLLFDAFCEDELPRHRSWACELAETFGGPDVLPTLVSLTKDVDGHVRKSAACAYQAIRVRS